MTEMPWRTVTRADPKANRVAKRHYNCQSPHSDQFVPPGRYLALYLETARTRAYWVTSWPFAEFTKHAWAGAWVCSAFRLEGGDPGDASSLIAPALAATCWQWRRDPVPSIEAWKITRRHDRSDIDPIRICMVTFVDPTKTRHKRDPGRCFRRAGFVEIGATKEEGLIALGLPVGDAPAPIAPIGAVEQFELDFSSTRTP